MKDQLLNYLFEEFDKTKWPFYTVIFLRNKFGCDLKNEMNELFKEGWIKKRSGVNGDLIQLIKLK